MTGVGTPEELLPLIAPGAQVVVRDEEWLVRSTHQTPADGVMVRCIGLSTLVRDTEATFFTKLDRVEPLRPEDTQLVLDDSPAFRRARLYLEAVIRKTPVPATETRLAVAHRQLLTDLEYQRRAVRKALTSLRPRLLIADAVGLGKTLEVGMILSELIRRGRGERILVVTPRHILEQFQHELWTRFAIPLVRLDSEGIQRVRRHIPANRNPFTYYKRAIISIDTLKNAGRYRHHLEGIRWDAVVIDECHNLVNKGTLNNQLARVLAPRTEALLLTSATPHNGDPESFAELIRLLDPTAVVDAEHLTSSDIEHLYVRRHKQSSDVAAEVGTRWADRLPPRPILVEASPAENALFQVLADTWTHPVGGAAPTSGKGARLFPWTLFKAALSSHHALAQTIENRRKTLAASADTTTGLSPAQQAEDAALEALAERCAAIDDASSSKLQALVDQLKEIGIGPGSPTRVVVFSERIATLDWLSATVPGRLGLDKKAVRVLHGGMADVKQMDVVEEFGLADSPVRLLFTGDMASEGVNLHRECHHLIHFDLPWSLITIEQRNGRIDRYGQEHPPDIRALVLTPDHPRLTGDARILVRLLEREHHAHKAFGESGSLLGLHNVVAEEERVIEMMRKDEDPDEAIPTTPQREFDLMTLLAGASGDEPVPTVEVPSLFESETAFVDEALTQAFADPHTELDLRREEADPRFLSLVPPADLARRLAALPQSYLAEQQITSRLGLTADPFVAERHLEAARRSTDSQWPRVGHLSPLHPFVDWLVDKVLVAIGRNEAPVIVADVDQPTFCIQGMYSNGRGQPQLVEWMALTKALGSTVVVDLFDALGRAGVHPRMPNPGRVLDLSGLRSQLPDAVAAARAELERRRAAHDALVEERLAEPLERLQRWTTASHQLAFDLDERRRREEERKTRTIRDDTQVLIDSLRTAGQPMIRVLAVLVGGDS
jgi:ERCC4-related helicase